MRGIATAIVFAACIIAAAIKPEAWSDDFSQGFTFCAIVATILFVMTGV